MHERTRVHALAVGKMVGKIICGSISALRLPAISIRNLQKRDFSDVSPLITVSLEFREKIVSPRLFGIQCTYVMFFYWSLK